jgi:hypothetical protein
MSTVSLASWPARHVGKAQRWFTGKEAAGGTIRRIEVDVSGDPCIDLERKAGDAVARIGNRVATVAIARVKGSRRLAAEGDGQCPGNRLARIRFGPGAR